MKYNYLIVGAGLYGCVVAHELALSGKTCLVIDKRNHIGGNIYTEEKFNINVHKYGAHIFHTQDKEIWDYVNKFVEFNNYINRPVAIYKKNAYNLPFNMNTFTKLWKITTPSQAKEKIEKEKSGYKNIEPKNLEEQAIKLVGKTIYKKLIKGYTEKQWGRSCKQLPSFIIKRLPVRFTFDNNYFNDKYQGIVIGGYTKLAEKLLESKNISVSLNTSYQEYIKDNNNFEKVIYTGPIDEFFNYKFGYLKYRSVYFKEEILDVEDYQGNAVINYTERKIPYTRIIEHKHFENNVSNKTIIYKEYPVEWKFNGPYEPYYPVNDDENLNLLQKYQQEASNLKNVIFGGRLGEYKYYDMDKVIKSALEMVNNLK